jgi:hypothetical protein
MIDEGVSRGNPDVGRDAFPENWDDPAIGIALILCCCIDDGLLALETVSRPGN